ncbi:MAG: hypothetical protein H7263_05205 [Candidatus Sericytochromatia bacterium]|nr:hypothetical protein [Candidatus Sericytochromatia bacterium]
MKIKKMLNCILLPIFILSCSVPTNNHEYGTVNINFKFPQKGFSIKAIPEETDYINMKISSNTSETITKRINRNDSGKKVSINNLSIGEKKVEIQAFDKNNTELANTQGNVKIEAGKTSQITLELKELLDDLNITLNNLPDDSEIISELKVGSKVIQKQSTGNKINFGKFAPGKAKLTVAVLANDATPLAYVSAKEINISNNVSVALTKIDLNSYTDLTYSKILSIISNAIIDFKDNNKPVVNSFKVFVNDKEKVIPPLKKSICVNLGDKLRVEADSSDKDGDKLNYFWEKITPLNDGNYKALLENERGNILNQVVDNTSNTYSISFILTDKKSLVGPETIYFEISKNPCTE